MQEKLNPEVSVCIQTYNHEKYISRCLDSILNQKTSFQYEIILGEDFSTDKTRGICLMYKTKYPKKINLFLRSREDVIYVNGNATGRFNMISNLEACRGKYIALCEGDDYWLDEYKLQKQYDFISNDPNYSSVFHNSTIIDSNQKKLFHKDLQDYDINVLDVIRSRILFHTSSFFFKTKALQFPLPNFFYKVASGDFPLLFLLLSQQKGKYLNFIGSVYNKNSEGVTKNAFQQGKKFNKNRIILWLYILKHLITNSKFKIATYFKIFKLIFIHTMGYFLYKVNDYIKIPYIEKIKSLVSNMRST